MQRINETNVTEFTLLGFPTLQKMHSLFFSIFLAIYIMTVTGNLLIIFLISTNTHLHTPMYFFLGNFSLLEMGYTTVTVPKLLVIFLTQDGTILFEACITQLYFFFFLGATENFLLALMAFDRYVAICHPLHYAAIMSSRVCCYLAAVSWAFGAAFPLGPVMWISRLPFCGYNMINHFFCDFPPILELSCSDTSAHETTIFIQSFLVILSSFIFTMVSYGYIGSTILRIPSKSGRRKAFSTCASHLTVAVMYYGTVIFMYVRPSARHSFDLNKAIAVVYAVVTPALNPIIYSLRNKEVKVALRKVLQGRN
ncbi:olfactory receptor 6F1-like [Alligator mississippiensis]|uniref:olfactory receptor 6F1-like n=1 Tax=Alligator mississippiensis TaxID=8496 RepID=UPI002877BE3C|nr:olfactory receptor 6F1-like [Alligator mississippiensis]